MNYRKGWTAFFFEPGKKKSIKCKICYTDCEVEKNKVCSSSSIGTILDKKSNYDFFKCPHVKEEWHIKLEQLVLEKEKTASDKINNLLQEEIDEIKDKYLR
ncbi:MAG: hypothetical protein ACOCRX_11635 [Candidatus Woesearchaeota archaeon]